jgi:excisionase family DNA binding protein
MTETTNAPTPWLTVAEAAERARCGVKTVYREVRAGRLSAARIGGRRELRLLPEWVDQWLIANTTAVKLRVRVDGRDTIVAPAVLPEKGLSG